MIAEGTELGPYRIVKKIGEGGMGSVYVARTFAARPARRDQGPVAGAVVAARDRRSIFQRSARDDGRDRSGHRAGVRLRLRRRAAARHRDGVARRRAADSAVAARRDLRRRCAAAHATSRRLARGGARARHRPSRSQARQHLHRPRRRGAERRAAQDPRLRNREADRRRQRSLAHADRHGDGHADLHVARAVSRRGCGRSSRRHLLARLRALSLARPGGRRSTSKASARSSRRTCASRRGRRARSRPTCRLRSISSCCAASQKIPTTGSRR